MGKADHAYANMVGMTHRRAGAFSCRKDEIETEWNGQSGTPVPTINWEQSRFAGTRGELTMFLQTCRDSATIFATQIDCPRRLELETV